MKLNRLHFESDIDVLREYISELRKLRNNHKGLLTEGKRVIVTTEIVDDDEDGVKITKEAKNEFIEKAKEIGSFDSAEWVNKLTNGLKQVGVQGLQPIKEEERPVTNKEIVQLISALVDLISK
ncbi:MAG: hypothetical protein ACXABY_04625 [Candidatus Thorarchaeota archaeon]|jgi:hypothetical protein